MSEYQEDGVNAGARNVGRFFLAAIPWILGLAAAVWFGVYVGIHNFRHELSQEELEHIRQQRAAVYVGAENRPTGKMKVDIVPNWCVSIIRVDVDGENLLLYGRNDCHTKVDYVVWKWQEVSPNGTSLHTEWTNLCPEPLLPGDVSECKMEIVPDDRAAAVRVWTER